MAKKILLADDSITIQKVIMITFASEEYDIVIVGDGDAAVAKAKEIRPDLVMADVAMPGKNGYEVCDTVKNDPALKNTPVLLLAGTFEPLDKEEAKRVKADDSIVKPFESQELVEKVKDLLERFAVRAPIREAASGVPAFEPQKSLEVSEDIWEAGDFLGFPEEMKDLDAGAADLGFLEGGLFEAPQKGEELTAGFVDLEFKEEEPKKEEPMPDFELETFDRGFGTSSSKQNEPAAEEPAFDTSSFDFKTEPFEVGPLDAASFKQESSDELWETPADESLEAKEEPDIIEMPQEVMIIEPSGMEELEEAPPAPAPVFEAPEPFNEPPIKESPLAVSAADEKITEAVEIAAARVEERLREVTSVLEKAEAQMNRAIASVTAMAEENLKTGLNSAFQRADSQVAKMVETVAGRTEQKVREELGARLDGIVPQKAVIEDIIRKSAKEIVEQVVWEVIPELAENMIKAEIAKFKEAIARLK